MSPPKLTRERVLEGAVALADRVGMEGFTIRKLAEQLDTKPMSIYHHVPNKEAIIDGMVDTVFAEMTRPPADVPWQEAMTVVAHSVREVLARHPWATPLLDSRPNPGPATLTHHNAMIGCCRAAGFSIEATAHAVALIDAFVYGYSLQEAALPATGGEDLVELVEGIGSVMDPERYPHLVEFTAEHVMQPGYDFTKEFDFGLSLVLDGLEAAANP
ncbi:MAG: TetR/AcrR family transcriptional regulator [Actinomycetota bacterium]